MAVDKSIAFPQITFRIPGEWSQPRELQERLPAGYSLSPERLLAPDGTEIEFVPLPPDREFPQIFASSCRRPPQAEELAVVRRYRVNVGLNGTGGSMASALAMMQAGAAIVRAGGAGVFIDNCAMAHGGQDWLAMTEDGGPDAISFAFASIIRGRQEMYTMGMQVMGFPDLLMRAADVDPDGNNLVEMIRSICSGNRRIDVGHVLADESGPRFRVVAIVNDEFPVASPMHNPLGRLKLAGMGDLAQSN